MRPARPACHDITIHATPLVGGLRLTVTDDGIGLDDARVPADGGGGFGRIGMVERADAIGATLTWSRPPAGGTRVTLDRPAPDRPR